MGGYFFFIVCTGLWLAFGAALATRPIPQQPELEQGLPAW